MAKSKPFTIEEIRALIPRFAATAQMFEGLLHQYEGGKVKAVKGKAKAVKATNGRRGPRRKRRGGAGSDKIREKLLGALKGGKGLQLSDVVKRTGLDAGAVKYHLRRLRAAKQVRVTGSRKEARWAAT
jgi:DNA-binding transcriptional ArsR family regulator